jgi:Tol biopolymer transport system component
MRIKLIGMLFVLLASCSMHETVNVKAENSLDAGREYINACLQGDFSLAAAYMVADTANKNHLQQLEAIYRTKDKEGRQQLRTASINIRELKELNDSSAILYYSNSFENKPSELTILKKGNAWLVSHASPIK